MAEPTVRQHPILVVLGAAAAIVTILAFVFTVFGWPLQENATVAPGGDDVPASICEPQVSLSRGRGPSGTRLTISGDGFHPNSEVELRFHTEALPPARSDDEGTFSVAARIPGTFDVFAPFSVTIFAASRGCVDTANFRLTER
jgi:hypothetical protein